MAAVALEPHATLDEIDEVAALAAELRAIEIPDDNPDLLYAAQFMRSRKISSAVFNRELFALFSRSRRPTSTPRAAPRARRRRRGRGTTAHRHRGPPPERPRPSAAAEAV